MAGLVIVRRGGLTVPWWWVAGQRGGGVDAAGVGAVAFDVVAPGVDVLAVGDEGPVDGLHREPVGVLVVLGAGPYGETGL
jgi:hypothetical protein